LPVETSFKRGIFIGTWSGTGGELGFFLGCAIASYFFFFLLCPYQARQGVFWVDLFYTPCLCPVARYPLGVDANDPVLLGVERPVDDGHLAFGECTTVTLHEKTSCARD